MIGFLLLLAGLGLGDLIGSRREARRHRKAVDGFDELHIRIEANEPDDAGDRES